jgi:PKD repeat protein
MKKAFLLPWRNLLGCVLMIIFTLATSTASIAQSPINISTGATNTGDMQVDPNWKVTPTGASAKTVASYLTFWQPTPVLVTGARWINQSGGYGDPIGNYTFERTINITTGIRAVTFSFAIAYDDDIASVEIVDAGGNVDNVTSSVVRSTTPTEYYLSNTINRTYSCPNNVITGDWKIRIIVKNLGNPTAFLLSGNVSTTQGVCQSNCKAGFSFALSSNCGNVTFANTSTGTAPLTYTWNFGDPTNTSNTSTLQNPTHQFNACGTYNVCLYLTGANNCKDSICQRVVITDNVVPVITCPTNKTITCFRDSTLSINGVATATDNCSTPRISYRDSLSSGLPCNGFIRRTWTASDFCGNVSSCIQTITVKDTVPPRFTNCPPNQTVNTNAGVCYYTFPTPLVVTATDSCDPAPIVTCVWLDAAGVSSPLTATTQFPKGINTITCTARDRCGNVSTCSFKLEVVDREKPKITCPTAPIVVTGTITPPSTLCTAVLTTALPTVTDNCPMITTNYFLSGATTGSGSVLPTSLTFNQGTTTVTYLATDMAGNRDSCRFTVIVNCNPNTNFTCRDSLIQAKTDTTCCQYSATLQNLSGSGIVKILWNATSGTIQSASATGCTNTATVMTPTTGMLTFSPTCTANPLLTFNGTGGLGNIVSVNLSVIHATGDTCRVSFRYTCKTGTLCDSIMAKPYVFTPNNIKGKTFTVLNRKIPNSPICWIDIKLTNSTTGVALSSWQGGNMTFSPGATIPVNTSQTFNSAGSGGIPLYTRLPFPSATSNISVATSESVSFWLGVDWTSIDITKVDVRFVINHCDGTTCEFGPIKLQDPVTPCPTCPIIDLTTVTETVFPRRLALKGNGDARPVRYVSFKIPSNSDAEIFATSAETIDAEDATKRGLANLRWVSSGPKTAMFEFVTPVVLQSTQRSPLINMVFIKSLPSLTYTLYDVNGNEIFTKTEQITSLLAPKPTTEGLKAQVFPNPTQSEAFVQFELQKSSDIKIDLFNINGQFIGNLENSQKVAGTYQTRFNTEGYAKGAYFVRIVSNGATISMPLVIQ